VPLLAGSNEDEAISNSCFTRTSLHQIVQMHDPDDFPITVEYRQRHYPVSLHEAHRGTGELVGRLAFASWS